MGRHIPDVIAIRPHPNGGVFFDAADGCVGGFIDGLLDPSRNAPVEDGHRFLALQRPDDGGGLPPQIDKRRLHDGFLPANTLGI
ncbi:MAG: hypothetical protein ACKOSQ_08240 [Planctomycetaceae bacterium]